MSEERAGVAQIPQEVLLPRSGGGVRGLIDLARRAREIGYRAMSPLDALWRRLRREPELPPLWLRRHVGPVRGFLPAAAATRSLLETLGMLRPGITLLDLGCGCGAMALALREVLAGGSYHGIDVHGPCLDWCRREFAGDARFTFHLAEVSSPYSTTHGNRLTGERPEAATYTFPLPDASVDVVLAKSLFTHLMPDVTGRYLAEIRRVLKPEGQALLTLFLVSEAPSPAFPHPERGHSPVRWRRRHHPHAAIAYEKKLADALVDEAGLTTVAFVPGFYPGLGARPTGQDQVVVRRGSATERRKSSGDMSSCTS